MTPCAVTHTAHTYLWPWLFRSPLHNDRSSIENNDRYLSQVNDQSKISELADAVHTDEDVLGLDVHVDQVMVVQVLNSLQARK